ncbi:hypothetical protein [Occultella aeris]|uniref:hypothetical protein n=1 Tax=Occultella aeris TaxID=2761496 RepID=UPI0012EA84A0|nr:hypothetical protein [Occultella aeris]
MKTSDVYETAKIVASIGDRLSFEQAFALCNLVLLLDGGPVARKGKRAPIRAPIVAALERRGYVERGGAQHGRRFRVTSVADLRAGVPSWTTSARVSDPGRLTAEISASDEAFDLVAQAWSRRERKPRKPTPVPRPTAAPSPRPAASDGTDPADSFEVPQVDASQTAHEAPQEESSTSDFLPPWPLLAPLNFDAFVDGALPVTATLPAFDESGRSVVPPADHVLDAIVRQWGSSDEEDLLYSPAPFTVAITPEMPTCDVQMCQMAARFDMRVRAGDGQGWANLCPWHARRHHLTELGTGSGAYLLHPDEIRDDDLKAAIQELGLDEVLVRSSEPEPRWSHTYRALGFARDPYGSRLVRRADQTTMVAERLATGGIGLNVRETGNYYFDDGRLSFDRVVPEDWADDRVREVLFNVLRHRGRRGRDEDSLRMTLEEATATVLRGLDDGETRRYLRDYIEESERSLFAVGADESPFRHASKIVAQTSADLDVLRRVFKQHPHHDIRAEVVAREDCPPDILLEAVQTADTRTTLLRGPTLPPEVVNPLFTTIALSSATVEGHGQMLLAATHFATPLGLIEGLLEKALFEADARDSVLDRAEALDAERAAILRRIVLRKTHRGRVQDDLMHRLLGDAGLTNWEVIDWIETLDDRVSRDRALAWIRTHSDDKRDVLEQ